KVDLFPPLNFPVLNVIVEMPSFSSIEMERQVTVPIESAVSGVLGVTGVRSVSGTGIAMISVSFQWGTDMLIARQLLIEALSSAQGQLPPGAQPTIENLSATLSMIEGYSLTGGTDLVALRDAALFNLKPRLQRIPGVYKVLVMGGKVREYAIYPNSYLMIKYGAALSDLRRALDDNNILSSPGVVNAYDQELVLHVNGQFKDAAEIADTVVAVKRGLPVRVKDVARVDKEFQYERGDTSENGRPAVLIQVLKQPSFDTGAVAAAVRGEIAKFGAGLPSGEVIDNYYDQAQLVDDSIGSVKESVWIGALLVVLVLTAFLRDARTTLIATLSIPLSVLAAVVGMRAAGIGVNIMSLGGLAIGTGIIVDDTIIVLENIFRWLATPELRANLTHPQVVARATAEVAIPVVASTFANIGIFLPMVLVAGLPGRLFAPVSGTVTFALLASLVVALTVIPALADRFLSGHEVEEEKEGVLHRLYARALAPAFRRPKTFVLLGFAPALLAVYAFRNLDLSFLPDLDEGALLLNSTMPPGTSLPEAERVNKKIEAWAKGLPGVVAVVRRTGHAPGAEDTDNVNHSDIMLKLLPKNQRKIPLNRLIDLMGEKTSSLPNVLIDYLMPLADKINDALGGVPADIGVNLYGPDLDVLHGYSARLMPALNGVKGLIDLRPPKDLPVPSLKIAVDKVKAGRLGISQREIDDALRAFSSGLTVTSIREVQKQVDVVVHLAPAGHDLDLEALRSLPLKTAGGSTVPLEQVATVGYGDIPSEIQHDHMTRRITITANVSGRNAQDAAVDIRRAVEALKLPAGYSWDFSGKFASQSAAMGNMGEVFLLAVAVVAFILWLEFRSLGQVFLVLLTIPLAGVGAVWALWLCGETINVSSMIGAVLLVGIVVRNGIMLLDYMNIMLREGRSLEDAVLAAALKRLRPILMTAAVMVLGLLPLAVGWGTG
ncbi:MAG: efflux RND transporter permease subunit, partial [Elusimicrobia bacterium]|nr:efflux RND transporter permease subunit [Elusimicrobiota bacterium]